MDVKFWSPDPLKQLLCKSFFHCLVGPFPLGDLIFSILRGIKISRAVRFFVWQVIYNYANMLDRLVRKLPLLVGLLRCILCWKGGGRSEPIFWRCDLVSVVWDFFLKTFGTNRMIAVCHKDVKYSPQFAFWGKTGLLPCRIVLSCKFC